METCKTCTERAHFMEPCPRCGNPGTFGSHQERGLPETCSGCNEKFCTDCNFNCLYTCKFLQAQHGVDYMPPPPRLERQITEYKWEMAEEFMHRTPALKEYIVYETRNDIYKVIRRNGYIIRKHGTECCGTCGEIDIRYPEHRKTYDTDGFFCAKCIRYGMLPKNLK